MFPYINLGFIKLPMFGVMLVVALNVYLYCVLNSSDRKKLLSEDQLFDVFTYATLGGLVGGRLLYAYQHNFSNFEYWYDFFKLWDGGLAILGAIVGAVSTIIVYAWSNTITVLPLLDLAALYAPLAQSIARWGCFFNGCCHGSVCDSTALFSLTYTHPDSIAPLNMPLHPTQIYMSIAALLLFIVLLALRDHPLFGKRPGKILSFYIVGIGSSRVLIDFFRGDRDLDGGLDGFSFYQVVGLGLIIVGSLCLFAFDAYYSQKRDA